MARSRRHTPIRGLMAGYNSEKSERWDKREWHSRYRSAVRQTLHVEPEADLMPHYREHSNPWDMLKDGKVYWGPDAVANRPQLMRK